MKPPRRVTDALSRSQASVAGFAQRSKTSGSVTYLAFHAELIVKQWVPGWVRRWLAVDSMDNTLSKIRDRAQK